MSFAETAGLNRKSGGSREPALSLPKGICSSADLSWKCFPTERNAGKSVRQGPKPPLILLVLPLCKAELVLLPYVWAKTQASVPRKCPHVRSRPAATVRAFSVLLCRVKFSY
jgi:hypothetical protein